ncbi:hypothetical protein FB45DRAFT_889038 [Roridomyces roridus]|uniref:Uncharacterized protein n=1 Tax=Roridomyces roridus TaxID=1738132 RepID=A0AAD7G2N6_9AGAR|nr:hypothetical protein FB45DRAFT_889038 [Roridomyces roridus]
MSYPTKVAYPSPPPTTNSLTSYQRTQLLRTTQKLGRILGTTPALIEESDELPCTLPLNLQRLAVPLHIQLSSVYDDGVALNRYPSSDSALSSSSSLGSSLKRTSSTSSLHSHRRTKSVHRNENWPKVDRPFLRIALKKLSKLETIPQSPPAYCETFESAHTSFTLSPSRAPVPSISAPATFAALPTSSSLRRQKMDRLRRTLGEGVPIDLVFPDEETFPVPAYPHDSVPDAPQYTKSAPQRIQRIRSARDSLVVAHIQARPLTPRSLKKLSIIAEREEPYDVAIDALPPLPSPAPSDCASESTTDSECYHGDNEGESTTRRQSLTHRIKRVPVPAA